MKPDWRQRIGKGSIASLQFSTMANPRKCATQYFAGKPESSLSEVDLDPELVAQFHGYRAKAKNESDFVIRSNLKPIPNTRYSRYRCQRTFRALTDWLRKKEVPGKSPLHVLRKQFGSLIAEKHGIHAASTQLRHSDIGVTARHYLAPKARATAGLGHLLKAPENIVQVQPEELQKPEPRAARS
jgi:integrase